MKLTGTQRGTRAHSRKMTRSPGILIGLLFPFMALGQGGDDQLRAKAEALFEEQRYAEALPMFSQLVSLSPSDRGLNYRFGTCLLFDGEDKEKAVSYLKYATEDPSIPAPAWYWLGRAYHLSYRFKEAQVAYQRFRGTGDTKALAKFPVESLEKQCRNGEQLLSNLKEITVRNKVEVASSEFFRFYDLSDIGGSIVVLPEELKTSLDKKNRTNQLVYLPAKGGTIYFSSYGRDGRTGRDIYRTELMPTGQFAEPIKLAGYINTDLDEDFAFMHPDGRTFYFSSKGHNSMGGFDVFRSTYDRGLDAFGRPENMDFAVNTPDDDILYVVDGEHKEACFASGRSSGQDKLHVYRVGTAQQPLIITVFKGTFASSIDKEDRKAHILVEDAVTRERVADVRTDINGSYVLSLPRSGSFRYLVECGPSGRTHTGIVEVPKTDGPRAYRQELTLDRNGDLEQLTIRNYFDTPLDDDLIALSLDEIKRRARLDITPDAPIAQAAPPDPEPTGDIMTRAGFTGDIDQAAAIKLANEDAAELDREALDLAAQRDEAYALALEASAEADRTAALAIALVDSAATETDQEERNARMVEAARARQRSREANLRSRAAFRTGTELDAERSATEQRAVSAKKLSTDLAASLSANDEERSLSHLRTLKERLDSKSGPDAAIDVAEKARRAVTENEKQAAEALRRANTQRADENELTDRVARLKREQEDTRSRARKEELQREITGLEEQLGHLRSETAAAYTKAAMIEKETAVLRGQASLTRHLSTTEDHGPGVELSAEQVADLGIRITGTGSRINTIPIDERYDAMLTATPAEVEARTFDWDLASAGNSVGTDRASTQVVDRSTSGNAEQASGRTTSVDRTGVPGAAPVSTTIAQVPPTREQGIDGGVSSIQHDGVEPVASVTTGTSGSNSDPTTESATARQDEVGRTERDASIVTGGAVAADDEVAAAAAETQRFLLENERAELMQMVAAERDRARRDSLQRRIAEVDQQLMALSVVPASPTRTDDSNEPDASEREELASGPVDIDRPIIGFDMDTEEADIIEQLFADYERDKQRLEQLPDADERAAGINGLELMLADSLRGEMARQVAVLDLAPQQAEQILPRVARLRQIREAHLQQGEQALQERQDELNALAGVDPAIAAATEDAYRPADYMRGDDPINDRFIAIAADPEEVFTSKVEHRATTVGDAVAFKDADISRMEDLTDRIDSLEDVLSGMPDGRDFDRVRKEADQMIDERMIIRTDLGQRSAFLTKEEWRTANDSLQRISSQVATRGLSPSEPVLMLAQSMQAEAKQQFDQAAQLRKRADRIDDIVERDSLYRRAYAMELSALRELDRSITVQNYLAGDEHTRGETLAYEPIAARVLGITVPVASEADPANAFTDADTDGTGVTEVTGRSAEQRSGEEPTATDARQAGAGAADASIVATEASTSGAGADPVNTKEAAAAAAAQARSTEARLSESDRRPLALYQSFLQGESTTLPETLQDPEMEPLLLGSRADRAAQESAALERRSLDLADQAILLTDSAAKARKRDRMELEQLAVLTRSAADSMHAASLVKAEEARIARAALREAEQARAYRERLVKYYYLTPEEQAMVIENIDHSRYFQAKTRALEQYDAADEAANAAVSNREVGRMLQQQAGAAHEGGLPEAEAAERSRILSERAAVLLQRADSLDDVAARLRGAAAINENQASVLLQGMPADRSTDLMALEMRTRRTEPMLVQTRTLAQPPTSSQAQRTAEQGAGDTSIAAVAGTNGSAGPAGSGNSTPPATQGRLMSGENGDDGTAQAIVQPATVPRAAGTVYGSTDPARSDPSVAPEPAPPTASRPEDTGTPLAPGPLLADVFEMRPSDALRARPIAIDAPMPSGIVFKVQIGAFRNAIPQEAFGDMSPVTGETLDNGLTRYTAGMFVGFDGAASAKDKVRERGYRDAFVVAYRDGRRIPLGEAMREANAAQPIAGQAPVRERPVVPAQPVVTLQPPAVAIPVTPEEDIETVLASYPATAEEVIARFTPTPEAASYYNVPGAAPARQVETVKGLFFTVQVGVYSKPVPLDRIFNITPLNSERTETAKVRYTTGIFLDMERARVRKDETVALGVKDAFITAYLNGRRIPMREASALLEKFGPAILAQP